MLHILQGLGREAGFAAIRQVIGDLKLGFARTQRIGQEVMIFLRAGRGVGGDGLSAGTFGLRRFQHRAFGQNDLEGALVVGQGVRRFRLIGDGVEGDALQHACRRFAGGRPRPSG